MRRDRVLLNEIIDAADQVMVLVKGVTADELPVDRNRWDALKWNFTVLGEASKLLSNELIERFPEVRWRDPIALRNRIVHGYWSIDSDVLYSVATQEIGAFAASVRAVLTRLDEEPENLDR